MQKLILCVILLTGVLSAGTITDLLQEEMADASSDQLIHVIIKPAGRADLDYINSVASTMNAAGRRQFAVAELKQFAATAQEPVLEALNGFPAGSVEEIRTNWIVSAIGCAATPEVIRAIAAREDVEWVSMKTFPNILIEPVEVREPTREEILLANAWGVDKIDAPDVWAMGYEGQGIIVSVVDTGVTTTTSTSTTRCGTTPPPVITTAGISPTTTATPWTRAVTAPTAPDPLPATATREPPAE